MAFDRFSTTLRGEAVIALIGFAREPKNRIATILRSDLVKIIEADDLADAHALIADTAVDLIILDETTGGAAVYDFCRASSVRDGPSILLMCARDDVVSQIVALEVGADEVLPSDVDDRLLAAHVRARLRRSRPGGRGNSKPSDWSVDAETRVATGPNGGRVELARHQVRLMQIFLANPGVVITAERLEQEATDMRLEPAAFRTAMSRLRRRLAPLDSRDFLRIVRGRGYVHLPGED